MKWNQNPENVAVVDKPPTRSFASRLLTARQASQMLRLYIDANFSSMPPAGYDYQNRTYYTGVQLFEWLAHLAEHQVRIQKSDLLNDRMAPLNVLSGDHANDNDDDDDSDDEEDDDDDENDDDE